MNQFESAPERPAESLGRTLDSSEAPVAELVGVGKRFGGTWALSDVSLSFHAGEIHALVGENGAGKSTCLGMLAGRHTPTEGGIRVHGREETKVTPRRSRDLGISAVYQELNIFPDLTVAQNLVLGREKSGPLGWLSRSSVRGAYRDRAQEHDFPYRATQKAGALSIAGRQRLELMRCLDDKTTMLLLDEPTAALPPLEASRLLDLVRTQRDAGVAVIFVSHNLNEVLDLADVVTVFRNGKLIATRPSSEWDEASLITEMVGRNVSTVRQARTVPDDAPVAMTVRNLSTPGKLRDISFELRRGEILGVAGLAGAGRSTLLRALGGDLGGSADGEVEIGGKTSSIPKTCVEAIRRGLALLPEDRRRDGLFIEHPAWRNIVVGDVRRGTKLGFTSPKKLVALGREAAKQSSFAESRIYTEAALLSGGNQQKLLVARTSYEAPLVLLADEPTRGVDIVARADIWRVLKAHAEAGLAIVVVSSELEELMLACDRILVLSKGRVVRQIAPDDPSVSAEAVLQHAFDIGGSLES
jgi:ribose transport system ATP-binding protein